MSNKRSFLLAASSLVVLFGILVSISISQRTSGCDMTVHNKTIDGNGWVYRRDDFNESEYCVRNVNGGKDTVVFDMFSLGGERHKDGGQVVDLFDWTRSGSNYMAKGTTSINGREFGWYRNIVRVDIDKYKSDYGQYVLMYNSVGRDLPSIYLIRKGGLTFEDKKWAEKVIESLYDYELYRKHQNSFCDNEYIGDSWKGYCDWMKRSVKKYPDAGPPDDASSGALEKIEIISSPPNVNYDSDIPRISS